MQYYLFRAYVIGESKSGKTSIVKRLTADTFSDENETTEGLNYYAPSFRIGSNVGVKF